MRKSTFLFASLACFSSLALAVVPEVIDLPANFDAWNLNFKLPVEKLRAPENAIPAVTPADKPSKMRIIRKEGTDTKEYFVAAQKFHRDYTFNYEGGDIVTYPIEVKVDGNKVTISNLFNLEAQSTEWSLGVDYDIKGTYDADAATITIPTSSNFEEATYAGTIGTYFTEVLACGTVTEDGKLTPQDELVFNVIGDFEAITTDTPFGIYNYNNDGSVNYGAQAIYRRFYAALPSGKPMLISFNDSYSMGTTFVGQKASNMFTVVNVSDDEVDFAIECESDNDAYSADPEVGAIKPRQTMEITVNFLATEAGNYEGLISLEYDAIDAKPIEIFYEATAIDAPDFSPVVKKGDFTINTNIEFPFEITSIEDGTTVARSTTNGQIGVSKLNVEFEVPEDNIGMFAWKGQSVNASIESGYWYHNAGGYFVDDAAGPAAIYQMNYSDDISNTLEFGPGKHSVRFQYEGLYYSGNPASGLYVYDLELLNNPAPEDAVVIETPEVNLGKYMIKDENGVEGQSVITIRSKGKNPLSVTKVSSDSENFIVTKPSSQAGLLETIDIPVMLRTNKPGEYEAEIKIETTGGNVSAKVSAYVRKMADFSSIITEGAEYITLITTDDSLPFEVEDGVAYNANSGEPDEVATTSWFQINYTIPDGKAGYLSWDGISYGTPDPENYWIGDYSIIEMSHPLTSGFFYAIDEGKDASSNMLLSQPSYEPFLTAVPGDHNIRFCFYKNGDGQISEKDRLEISNFRIRIEDFEEYAIAADKTEIEFEPIYIGVNRYLSAEVNIKNLGSQPFTLIEGTSDEPFYAMIPETPNPVAWNNTQTVHVWFFPTEEGEFEGTVTFKTTSGDIDVHCYGSTKESEGILLNGDVEDTAYGWSLYDADGDGNCWTLGTNLAIRPEFVHSGIQCFASPSWNLNGTPFYPDNWLISPSVYIPEDGAMLRWYAAAHSTERPAEHYSVYIASPETVKDTDNLSELEPIFSETLGENQVFDWSENVIDLSEYADEDIVVLFRHHDSEGQYVLRIDDIFIYDMEKWNKMVTGVNTVEGSLKAVSTETFDINGVRTRGLVKGVNIIRTTYNDGSVKSSKIIVK